MLTTFTASGKGHVVKCCITGLLGRDYRVY